MSGFVGILHLDGQQVDSAVLERLAAFLTFRGPDAQNTWSEGSIGLGHTLLRVTTDSDPEYQPTGLDRRLWIVADARIDGRSELIGKLKAKNDASNGLALSTPDAELILHAYDTWGESCVEYLLGDFSFAVWDAAKRKLFCARDQMGVKLFFYAHLGSLLIFSNTLDCLLQHPLVSNRLNDLAIADFLLFDANQDAATTSFADVQRLPPAHTLKCEHWKISSRHYWELSVTTPIHYSHDQEYVEHFLELFDTAVADRLRSENVAVLMSGGLDSSTVAASAQRILTRSGNHGQLQAFTEVFDSLIPHEERRYSKLVADALKIPIEYLVSDNSMLFQHAEEPGHRYAEPTHLAWPDTTLNPLRQRDVSPRVVLTGDGSDGLFCNRITVHFRRLFAARQYGIALRDAARFLAVDGRWSRLYLRTRWRLLFASETEGSCYPEWLNEDLENRLGLRDRWNQLTNTVTASACVRPEAMASMADSAWQSLFEAYEGGVTRILTEVRHPFFDLRLMNFLLALPRLPWCSDKQLLRDAGRGVLPKAVRLRRKSPLRSDPVIALLNAPESAWVDRFEPTPELGKYVVRNRVRPVCGEQDSWAAWIRLRPLSLNFWLRGLA